MIEIGKVYRTREGKEVRIYAVDGEGAFPVHAAVKHTGWTLSRWTASGAFFSVGDSPNDLIEVKPEHTRWHIVSPYLGYDTQEDAREAAQEHWEGYPVAVVPVTFREGDGL